MNIIINALFIHNIVLYYGCGVPLIVTEKDSWKTVAKVGVVYVVIMMLSSFLLALLENIVFKFNIITYLRPVIYIIIVSAVSAVLCILFSKIYFFSEIRKISGIMLIDNAALIFGLSVIGSGFSVLQYIIAGFSCGLGFLVITVIVSAVMQRIEDKKILSSFNGIPIMLIIWGIVSIAISFIK